MVPEPANGTDEGAVRTDSTPTSSPAGRDRDWTSALGRWTLELIVVFVGVYTAFALSEYQEGKELERQREQIETALAREIAGITANTRRAAEQIPRIAATYDSLIAAGTRPTLEPMIEPIRVRNHMWEATLESGALDLLDVPTLYRVSEFYNTLNAGFEQLAQLRELCETVLIPNLSAGADEFYDADGALRPKYEWYLESMYRVGQIAQEVTELGDELVADLGAAPAAD